VQDTSTDSRIRHVDSSLRIGKSVAMKMTAHITVGDIDCRLLGVADLIAYQ
jgi:hypothetical protein